MATASYGSFVTDQDASGVSNFTALQAILKEFYGPQQVKNLVYKRNKWLAMIHKEEDWSGLVVPIPLVYGNPQGASANFGFVVGAGGPGNGAGGMISPSKAVRFIMNWTQDYAVAVITNLVNLASRNDAGAFLKAIQNEMNGALRTAENRLAGGLFRSFTGTIGSGNSHASNGTQTLVNPTDITQIEAGQILEASTSDGGAAIGAPVYGWVFSVNRAAGTFVVATTAANAATRTGGTPTGWNGQVIFYRVAGDVSLRLNGLTDWLPLTAPGGADSFNGVNRSDDATRLAGVRWDGSGQTIEEALIDAAALTAREDGNPELCLTNHTSFAALEKALGSKVNYVNYEHDEVPGIGFTGIRVNGADAEINVFADRSCQGKRGYLLDPDSWTLGSMKPCPHILTELDGLTELRDATRDATQIRIGSYAIKACNAPGRNAVVQFQA